MCSASSTVRTAWRPPGWNSRSCYRSSFNDGEASHPPLARADDRFTAILMAFAGCRLSQRMYGAMVLSIVLNSLTDNGSCRKAAVARCGVYSPTVPSEP
jgi:hypothetical protein